MSDSSWQQIVLRELGASQRGLAALVPSSPAPAHGSWGADAAPQPVEEPKPIEVPQEPHPPVPVVEVSAPVVEVPQGPPPVVPGDDPFGPPPPADPEPAPPAQHAPGPPDQFGAPPAQDPAAPQPPVVQPPAQDQPAPPASDPFGPPPPADPHAAQPPAAQQPPDQFGAQQPAAQQPSDPYGPPPAQDPHAAQQGGQGDVPHVQAPGAPGNEPIMREGFSPEMAMAPVVGNAPPDLGGAPPDAEDEVETAHHEAPAQPPAPAPPPPQQHGPVVPSPDEFLLKNQHGDPLMRRVGQGLRRAVGGSGGGGFKDQAEIVELLRRPVPSYRQIAVVSVRGGAGKTTISALVASELARHRTDRVIAVDADAELGSLPLRLGVRAERSLFDLAGQSPRSFEEAAQYLTRTAGNLWVLSSTRGGRIAGEFTIDTFQQAVGALSRYVSAAVVDCGAGILTELHRGILATTHAQVLVTPGTVDGALSARGALEWFANNGQAALLSRTVIAMVTHAPHGGADLDRAGQMLSSGGMPVVYVPYDRHLAVGGALDPAKVSEATRTALVRVVAEVFARSFGPAGVAR